MVSGTASGTRRLTRLMTMGAVVGLAALAAGLVIDFSGANDPPAPAMPALPRMPGQAPGGQRTPSVPQMPTDFPTDFPTDLPSDFPTGMPSMPSVPSMPALPSMPSFPGGAP
ncbi:hypothetical protein EBO15_26670 [Actinomadura harenae]|uniref:Uncharacterized protein n=2 Tax=Actinomadura harenae TaxID=2483351 RepID=A0A3M2LV66_9ACTN|nr:hypothetical protein EBO15_26670 [Actinomadura harenae]